MCYGVTFSKFLNPSPSISFLQNGTKNSTHHKGLLCRSEEIIFTKHLRLEEAVSAWQAGREGSPGRSLEISNSREAGAVAGFGGTSGTRS